MSKNLNCTAEQVAVEAADRGSKEIFQLFEKVNVWIRFSLK
jgi:hypothetical protein